MPRYRDFWYYEPSVPLPAAGGIKSRSKRGGFAASWWGKRWITVLESFDLGARLSRGRSYARRGQVLSLDIAAGEVRAKVQGSRPRPYEVRVRVETLDRAQWQRVSQALAENVLMVAKLLAGEIPPEVEEVFRQAGASLFPDSERDLTTSCSCPDWSNPCKHIAAVYYLLGEEFDRDPFLIFRLRGMTRDALMALLGEYGAPSTPAQKDVQDEAREESEPLSADAKLFWIGMPVPEDLYGSVNLVTDPAPWARRLGSFPFWRSEEDFLEAVGQVSRRSADAGLRAYLGLCEDGGEIGER